MRLPLLLVLLAAAVCSAPSSTQAPQRKECAPLSDIPQAELNLLFPGNKISEATVINGTRVSCGLDVLLVKSVKERRILSTTFMGCGSDGLWVARFGFRSEKFYRAEVACRGDVE